VSAEKVKRFLKELRAVKGARYGWHFVRPGDTHLPHAEPMYTRGEYTPEYVRKHGVNCTGLGNQALGRMGLPVPDVPTNNWWKGGTPEWFDALKNRRRITQSEIERGFPVGTALISDYVDDNHQGHIVWVSTPMKNGKQMTIGSDDAEPGPGTPGVTEQRTAREAVRLFGLTHAGETPGIGVMDQDGADADDGAHGDVADPDGVSTGSFSVVDLREAMPTLPLQKAKDYFPHLVAAMREAEITTRLRACHFLAQLGHESVDLLYMQELGDRNYFMRYEGRRDLGNTQPGDGPRYHGRGPIQLTGRANYRAAGRDLGLDLEGNPEKAADPDVAFRIAGWYWTTRNLNKFADLGDAGVDDVTRLINGGYNGLDDRRRRYFNCKRVLPESFSIGKGRAEGGDMAFQRVILAHATHEDGVLAHEAAAVLHRHGIRCTVADSTNIKAAIAECQSEEVGWGDFVVIGKAAMDMFPDKLKRYIGETARRSDYRDAVGEDLEETADKLARVLDGIASRKDVSGDLRREFESSARLVPARRPEEREPGQEREEQYEERNRKRRKRSERPGGDRVAEEEESDRIRSAGLADEDLEEIGRETLEFFSTIRSLTGEGRSPQ
jgi:predicted chitinase